MKFSIIIPSFGQRNYVGEAIESALEQTIPKASYEVIVVDDGSNDGSYDLVLNTYGDQVKLIRQTNKGLASARNTGIMNAKGEYCFFLDADDKMKPNCLREIVRVIQETDADVIAPSITCFTQKDTYAESEPTILIENPSFNDFKEGNRLAYCCAIKRSTLLEVGGYSPKMDTLGGYEDLHLWYTLMSRGKLFKTIQEPLVMYRIKEKSMYTEAKNNHEKLWAQILKDFPQAATHYRAI